MRVYERGKDAGYDYPPGVNPVAHELRRIGNLLQELIEELESRPR